MNVAFQFAVLWGREVRNVGANKRKHKDLILASSRVLNTQSVVAYVVFCAVNLFFDVESLWLFNQISWWIKLIWPNNILHRNVLKITCADSSGRFLTGSLNNLQISSDCSAYIMTCLWFAYVEGYKGFQLKFSPLVVARSFTLTPSSPIHHLLLAPLYSMGLFHATKKRMIVSWSVSIGVAAVVAAVKRLPYPWRNIVDAGVVIGLSWGTMSMLGGYIISLVTGIAPIDVDPALPEK